MSTVNEIFQQVSQASHISLKLMDLKQYDNIKKDLINAIKFESNPIIQFYGSRAHGLATEKSDLDIFVDFDDGRGKGKKFYSNKNKEEDNKILDKINDALKVAPWKVNDYIFSAKVPLVKATHLPTNIDCDIIVCNGLAVLNSKMLKQMLDIQPQARDFVHFVRLWLKKHGVEFKSYTIALLVIYYLQTKGMMPSVQKLQEGLHPMLIDGYPVQMKEESAVVFNGREESYKQHVKPFFAFYCDFAFDKYVISTRYAKTMTKADYQTQVNIKFKTDKPMCISNLLIDGHNAAAYITQPEFNKFIAICKEAVSKLMLAGY